MRIEKPGNFNAIERGAGHMDDITYGVKKKSPMIKTQAMETKRK